MRWTKRAFIPTPQTRAPCARSTAWQKQTAWPVLSGGSTTRKNPLFLIEIFAALAQRDPAWKLLLVGGGEMEPDIRAAVARHGLQGRVLFAGVQDDVPAYMNAS